MHTETQVAVRASDKRVWVGRAISAIAVLFLLFDGVAKVMKTPAVVETNVQLGYPDGVMVGIGILLLVTTIVYVIPRASFLGAILLTGYLGGAVATHVRVGSQLFSHVLFPVYLAVLVWAGLFLREERLRALVVKGR